MRISAFARHIVNIKLYMENKCLQYLVTYVGFKVYINSNVHTTRVFHFDGKLSQYLKIQFETFRIKLLLSIGESSEWS